MTPDQAKLARISLKLTVRDVERLTGVNKDSVSRYESGKEIVSSAFQRLEQLYLDRGVTFIDADEHGGPGIRMPAPLTSVHSSSPVGSPPKRSRRTR